MLDDYIIRQADAATAYDLEALTQIAHQAFLQSRYEEEAFASDRVNAAIRGALEDVDAAAGFLLCRNGTSAAKTQEVVGALLAVAGPFTAARATVCNAPLFFVQPEARKSKGANLLLAAYLDWARLRNAFDASLPILSGHQDVERVGLWLERKGLLHTGDNFSKRI